MNHDTLTTRLGHSSSCPRCNGHCCLSIGSLVGEWSIGPGKRPASHCQENGIVFEQSTFQVGGEATHLSKTSPQGDGSKAACNWCISRVHMELWSNHKECSQRASVAENTKSKADKQTRCFKTFLALANCSFMTQSLARGEALGARRSGSCGQCQLQCRTGGLVQTFCYWEKRSSSRRICFQLLSRGHLEHQIILLVAI